MRLFESLDRITFVSFIHPDSNRKNDNTSYQSYTIGIQNETEFIFKHTMAYYPQIHLSVLRFYATKSRILFANLGSIHRIRSVDIS